MEVTTRYNMCLIIIPAVKNEPGVGEEIMGCLYESAIDVEYFNAIAVMEDNADIIILIRASDIDKAVFAVNKARKKVGGEKPKMLTELATIIITGVGLKESSSVLHRTFAIIARFKVNVLLAYTTFTAANLFVESENLHPDLMDALRKEFETQI